MGGVIGIEGGMGDGSADEESRGFETGGGGGMGNGPAGDVDIAA